MAGTIAFIGCGAMGAPMAERLIDGGFPVTVFDINKEAIRPLVERGAVAGDSPREAAAEADTAFACLPSPEVSRQVAFGSEGIVECDGLRVYVEMSTIGSDTIKEIVKGWVKRKSLCSMHRSAAGRVEPGQARSRQWWLATARLSSERGRCWRRLLGMSFTSAPSLVSRKSSNLPTT